MQQSISAPGVLAAESPLASLRTVKLSAEQRAQLREIFARAQQRAGAGAMRAEDRVGLKMAIDALLSPEQQVDVTASAGRRPATGSDFSAIG